MSLEANDTFFVTYRPRHYIGGEQEPHVTLTACAPGRRIEKKLSLGDAVVLVGKLLNAIHHADPTYVTPFSAALAATAQPSLLASYIIEWLETRNKGELREALDQQRIRDRKLMLDELTLILRHGGKPPNWP